MDNPCFLTISCNAKEYYEMLENSFINKNHKRIEKGCPGMNFENYAERLVSLTNFDTITNPVALILRKYQD